MEDFTKSERVMSMFEFKKALIEDEITEVFMKTIDHVAVNDNRQSRVINDDFRNTAFLATFRRHRHLDKVPVPAQTTQ